MTWNPLGFRERPNDPRADLPIVQNTPPPASKSPTVDFRGPCPGCGLDVWWHATPGATGELSLSRPPTYTIDCDCP